MQVLFGRIEEENPSAGDAISASRLVIHIRCVEPEAEVTINGRKHPVAISYGSPKMRPTLQIELATQTLHRILLGELGLRQAFTRGQLKVRGPVHRIMVLANLFDELQKYYPQVLQEQCLASNR
jgi:hypothetical protein